MADSETISLGPTEQELASKLLRRVLVTTEDSLLSRLDSISAKGDINESIQAFRQNMRSAVQVASIPFTLSHGAAQQQRWQAMLSAERIRQLNNPKEEKREEAAREKTRERFVTEQEEVQRDIIKGALFFLTEALKHQDFNAAAEELLRQVLVMSWGAFEVFAADLIAAVLNSRPQLALQLFRSRLMREKYSTRGVPFEILASLGLDLGHKMGTLLCSLIKLDSVKSIEEIYTAAFKSPDLSVALKQKELWLLFQRRNLIVHRRSVIDAEYLEKTPDRIAVGTKLTVDPDYLENSMSLVIDIASKMAMAAIQTPIDDI